MGSVLLSGEFRLGVFRSPSGLVLVVLLLSLLAAAAAIPRDASRLAPTEATYLLAGKSLAHDRDLAFSAQDQTRIEELEGGLAGDDLLLRRSDRGDLVFDVQWIYPALMAPFVALAPLRGPLVLNALLFALTAALVSVRLGRQLGRSAPALVAVGLFASVAYRNTFLIQPTVLMVALAAAAVALVLRHEEPAPHGLEEVYRPPDSVSGSATMSLLVGAMIGLLTIQNPWFSFLVLPAGLATPERRRRASVAGLLAGLVLVLAFHGSLNGLLSGSPGDAFAPWWGSWKDLSVGTSTWNLLYLVAGRNTGLLPYFLPLVALLGLWQGGTARSILVLTVLAGLLVPLALDPFDYFGGPAAVGNARALPWLVLLLFLPRRALPRGWILAAILLAAPFMYPTWLAPDLEPVTGSGMFRHRAGRLHRWLPSETTQRELPPGQELSSGRLFLRSLSREASLGKANRWRLAGEDWAEVQLASPVALAAVYLQFGAQAEPDLEVRGGELGDTVLLADGGIGFRVENLSRKALHPMWFSQEQHYNYVIEFFMPGAASRAQTLVMTALAEDLTGGR